MNKILLTLAFVLALCGNAFSATCSAVSVMPSGGDYAKLSDAVAYLQANCATLSAPSVITISGTWSSPDTTAVTISGITTSSTNTITVTTSGTARHDGTAYKSGAYKLSAALAAGNYNIFDGIIKTVGEIGFSINGGYITIKNCVLVGDTSHTTGFASGHYNQHVFIYNNVFFNFKDGQYYAGGAAVTEQLTPVEMLVYNNTCYNSARCFKGAGNMDIRNNIGYALPVTSDQSYEGTFHASSSNNLSRDATSPNTALRSKTLTFTNTTAGYENFALISTDTNAIDAGATLTLATDIIGTSRPQGSAWDIGAFEYISSAVATWGTRFANFTGKNFIYPGK